MRAAAAFFCFGLALCVVWILVPHGSKRHPAQSVPSSPPENYLIWQGRVVGNPGRPMTP